MKNKKEKQILKIIKFTPPLFIVLVSFFITFFLYIENKNSFIEEKNRIEKEQIDSNKSLIKEEINKVHEFILHIQKATEEELKMSIKSRVYEAHTIATNIYEKYKNEKSKEEIIELIKISLGSIRFNDGRGYIFIDDITGTKVLYPINKKLEDVNLLDFQDVNGYRVVETIVQTIKNKSERFDEYFWNKPNTPLTKTFKKMSFYKYFEPYNLAIGSGEYVDDFEKMMQKKALDYIRLIKFAKSEYIFVINFDGILLNGGTKEHIGKSVTEFNKSKQMESLLAKIKSIPKEGDYFKYNAPTLDSPNLIKQKIGFGKAITNWNWLIGTGFYEDDIKNQIQKRKELIDAKFDSYIENILIISTILTLVLLFISIYISRLLESKFNSYKSDINRKQTLLFQQSKMAAMGEMIGNIAHQWRQPLSIITTASSGMVLQKQLGTLNDEFFYDASNKINASAQHLSKTIDDFRNFFNPDKVKVHFYLKNTFSTTLELLNAQFKAKSIKIIKHIENTKLHNYENELIQALINILNNARDELLKIEDENRFIFIDVHEEENNKVVILIKDSAGGIKEEHLHRIFEPYFTTKHKAQGTGIGLYMTEEIITKHLNGKLEVFNQDYIHENKALRGAIFKIVLDID